MMKQRDIREAAKAGRPVAIGRPHIRGEKPTSLRQAVVLKFPVRPDTRSARVRYVDNGAVDTVSMRDVFAPWSQEFTTRQLVVERGNETETAIRHVPLHEIFVDYADSEGSGYQRQRTEEEALQIAMAPDRHRWEVPHVADRRTSPDKAPHPRGKPYAMIDGTERLMAAELLGRDTLRCEVHEGLTKATEAKLHEELGIGRRPQSALDRFRSQLDSKEPTAVAIFKLVKECGWKIGPNVYRGIAAIQQLRSAYNIGPDCLKQALWLCEPWAEDGNITGPVLEGMTLFVHDFPNADLNKARDKFSKLPMSTIERRAAERSKLAAYTNAKSRAGLVAHELMRAYNSGRRTRLLRYPQEGPLEQVG